VRKLAAALRMLQCSETATLCVLKIDLTLKISDLQTQATLPHWLLQVAVPYLPTGVNVFVDVRVAHCSKVSSGELYQLGIMYLAENEP
jgi:hypothetical protein